jgi:hypothetical protein
MIQLYVDWLVTTGWKFLAAAALVDATVACILIAVTMRGRKTAGSNRWNGRRT